MISSKNSLVTKEFKRWRKGNELKMVVRKANGDSRFRGFLSQVLVAARDLFLSIKS